MPQIAIQTVKDGDLRAQPIFDRIEKRLDDVQRRAFELYEMRGYAPGYELDDWLKAEQEVLGLPPLETLENDLEFEFQLPLDDFDVGQVSIIVTPTEIIVHAANLEQGAENNNGDRAQVGRRDLYRRIALTQPISVDKTMATLHKGTVRIKAAKAIALKRISATA